jgi:hypothetical protein
VETYWDSPEAKKRFLGNINDEHDIVEALEEWIEWLQQANKAVDGWRDIVDKHDNDNLFSSYDVFIIRQRCSILCLANNYALDNMNSARWIEDCCTQAIFDSNKMGIEAAATHKRTVAGWNILLRANNEHFPLPNPCTHKEKNPLPDLLEYFHEEITLPFLEYCIENLADFTVELACNELITKIIPKANAQMPSVINGVNESTSTDCDYKDDENENNRQIQDCLLQVYLHFPISISISMTALAPLPWVLI